MIVQKYCIQFANVNTMLQKRYHYLKSYLIKVYCIYICFIQAFQPISPFKRTKRPLFQPKTLNNIIIYFTK